MINFIKSNKEGFKEVHFESGFNVVLAERTKQSSAKDSRNGVGKSTLIEIIHFCLGSDLSKNSFLATLKGHEFTMGLTLGSNHLSITRMILMPDIIILHGDVTKLLIEPEYNELYKGYLISNDEWKNILASTLFGLKKFTGGKYQPSFRTLISYFIRKGVGGYSDPFTYFPNQKPASIQSNNNFLLGIGSDYAVHFQKIKDDKVSVNNFKKLVKDESLKDIIGSAGELQAEKVRLIEESAELGAQIKVFKVHPQYKNLQDEANLLTEQIHSKLDQINLNRRILTDYENSLQVEEDVSIQKVNEIYLEAGLTFDKDVINRLGDVEQFHKSIIKNRKEYLTNETKRVNKEIVDISAEVEILSNKRAGIFTILETHSALDEYSLMQTRYNQVNAKLENVKDALERLNKFQESKSNLKIKLEELLQNSRLDLKESFAVTDKALSLFNQYSKFLYNNAGTLSVTVEKSGYKYKVDIKSSQSQGINYMKVFCYDLTFTAIQASFSKSLFLIHDSTIFDGVDERQVAKALELAYEESKSKDYQYICTLNSDNIPKSDFSENFKAVFDASVRLILTDGNEKGSLLGFKV